MGFCLYGVEAASLCIWWMLELIFPWNWYFDFAITPYIVYCGDHLNVVLVHLMVNAVLLHVIEHHMNELIPFEDADMIKVVREINEAD